MSDSMKPITEGLGPLFADLQRRARASIELTTKVRQALPGEEKEHVLSAVYRNDTLLVSVDSAAWASRLHYVQQELQERLRAAGETQFTKIRIKVGPGIP